MPDDRTGTAARPARLVLAQASLVAGAFVVIILTCRFGEALQPPAAAVLPPTASTAPADLFFHVLLVLIAVVVTGQILGRVFAFLGQPPVIGEVVAGICLGPSVLGRLAPEVSAYLLPAAAAPAIGVLAQFGVVLYMFLVGLELDLEGLRPRARVAAAISTSSTAVPLALGVVLALGLYPRLGTPAVSFTSFALFQGVALSVTAFPVLARILTHRGLTQTRLGALALTSAAINDVSAWCLLALAVGIARANVSGPLVVVALTVVYTALMFVVVRPLLARLLAKAETRGAVHAGTALVFVGLLLSSLATELIGIHALFGAFLFGAIAPREGSLAPAVGRRLEDLVSVVLLPAFFAFTGLRTQIGLIDGVEHWLWCGAIVLVATAGKLGGTLAAARLAGLGWGMAGALGVLMNTRGLMELIVLNVGLDLGILSPPLFAMMVLMALATTMATGPALRPFLPRALAEGGAKDVAASADGA